MKNFFKSLGILLLCLILFISVFVPVSAESSVYVPYESYTYWDDVSGSGRKAVYNRPMYTVKTVLDANSLEVSSFDKLIDVCCDSLGNVYLLDIKSRILILDNNYKLIREIKKVTGDREYEFKNASSIYIHDDSTIYICDTENKRVIHCYNNGVYIDEYTLPKSPLIPKNFDYKPIKAIVDSKGFLYVLSEGSYYGALMYAPDKSFVGFYGANTVTNNIIGAIRSLLNRVFPNNTKAEKRAKVLPYCFSDIVIDGKDFIYTATDSNTYGQIKKLNPGKGNDILTSKEVKFIDDSVNRTYNLDSALQQRIIGLDVCKDNFIYCLDATYGRIFVYDSECRMLTAFGGGMGIGVQNGNFSTASAIAINNTDVLVSDSTNNSLTVFSRNQYGEKVMGLTKQTIQGNYAETKEGWQEVLREDKNLQVAYSGLARVYLSEDNYKAAMSTALEGYDRDTYALAYKYYRNEFISDKFVPIFIIAVSLIALIVAFAVVISKKKITLIKNKEAALMLRTLVHPGYSFEDIKEKGMGSIKLSVIILLVFYVSSVLKVIMGGFLFTEYDLGSFNSLWVFVQTVGLVALWVVSNWMICTLRGGKGRFKEIVVVTAYSLMPIIIEKFIWIALSNFLLPTESAFLSIMTTVALLYSFLLLIIGMMRIHEFTVGKFILTSLLTLVFMAAIAFLIILVMILVQQFGGFLVTFVTELFM